MKKEELGMLEKKEPQLALEAKDIGSYETTVEKLIEKYLDEKELGKDHSKIDDIIDEYNAEKGFLVSILQYLQDEYGYLTPETLIHVSKRLDLPLMQVYRVAMFYKEFKIESPTNASNKGRLLENNVKKDYLSKFTK